MLLPLPPPGPFSWSQREGSDAAPPWPLLLESEGGVRMLLPPRPLLLESKGGLGCCSPRAPSPVSEGGFGCEPLRLLLSLVLLMEAPVTSNTQGTLNGEFEYLKISKVINYTWPLVSLSLPNHLILSRRAYIWSVFELKVRGLNHQRSVVRPEILPPELLCF